MAGFLPVRGDPVHSGLGTGDRFVADPFRSCRFFTQTPFLVLFEGNYREYEEDKKRRMGDDAGPKRLRFKALK